MLSLCIHIPSVAAILSPVISALMVLKNPCLIKGGNFCRLGHYSYHLWLLVIAKSGKKKEN